MTDANLFAGELERLPLTVRRILELLVSGMTPSRVAVVVRRSVRTVYNAKYEAEFVLGDKSPLIAAVPRWRPGPYARGRTIDRDKPIVRLLTTAAPDGHVHVASFDDWGRGTTDLVAGHVHRILSLEIDPILGHRHELTSTRT